MTQRLQFLATLSRHFRLGESPRQTARRSWWDVLAMAVVLTEEVRTRTE